MPGLIIHLNGKKFCIASLGNFGVLSAHVSFVHRKTDPKRPNLDLHIRGLDSSTGEHLVWHEAHPLGIGDKVSIEAVKATRGDKPARRKRPDPAADLRARKRYVRKMAKELGW